MPLRTSNSTVSRRDFWPAIARIALVEILVLLALGCATVGYVSWSSEIAFAEFLAASKVAAPSAHAPLQAVKGQKPCGRSA